jgi:hypothetical protein
MKVIDKQDAIRIANNIEFALTERDIILITQSTYKWFSKLYGFPEFKDIDGFYKYYISVDKLERHLRENMDLNRSGKHPGQDWAYYSSSKYVYSLVNKLIKY